MPIRPNLYQYQAVLFDVDGTLIDSLYAILRGIGETIDHFKGYRPADSEIRGLIGMPLLQQMALFAEEPQTVREMASHAIQQMNLYRSEEKHFEDAVQCLRLCSTHGIKTALVTSKNSIELESFLDRFEAKTYVNTTVCASDVSRPKPDPESAYLACQRLKVDPTHCAFVGDSIFDMRCGRSAGMTCIAVAYGAGDKEALAAENPDLLFDTPDELLSWARENQPLISCPERN